MTKNNPSKKTSTTTSTPAPIKRLTLTQLLMRRLSTIALWYVTLAGALLLVLAWVSVYEPQVVSFLVSGKPALDFLTPAELAHMQDVRVLLHDAMLVLLSAVILLVGIATVQPIERGQYKAVLVMHIAIIVLLIPFPWTFTKFHAVFFPQGNWQFPTDSWLITHFSETFFAIVAFAWMGLATAMTYVLYKTSAKV